MQINTLRPGLLVSLSTSVTGNAHYERRVIEADHVTKEGKRFAVWETERTILDPKEHDAARKVRSSVCSTIRRVCVQSKFGMLCPEVRAKELRTAIDDAHKIADKFNEKASVTRVEVYVMCGRIAQNDVEALRAMSSEVRDLFKQMEAGISNLDARSIRAAAARVKGIGKMMSEDASKRIEETVALARATAKKIVKAGEQAAQEVDRETIKKLAAARTAFLDVGEVKKVARPKADGRALDMAPVAAKKVAKKAAARQMEVQ